MKKTTTVMLIALATAAPVRAEAEGFCTQTANVLFEACQAEGKDDRLVKSAYCLNFAGGEEREACIDELRDEAREKAQLCRDQRDGRRAACHALGEARYDPDFSPARFDDPRHATHPNPYFPLVVGYRWDYASEGETDSVRVTNESKRMPGGVDCLVVRDVVKREGVVHENTDDWYAHAKDGSTWYCGEEVKNFEDFAGDRPRRPELVSVDGSFKAGVDDAKPGVIFLANPRVGDVYVEEFALANAEDVTEILSVGYSFGADATLDRGVPRALAERMCASGDCVVSKNYSLLEPGLFARKYYAKGIGVFLEVESEGPVVQLVSCNFDSRCNGLPQP